MFASRALIGSERNYQNLERECLATIWGMEKSHYFLYGKEFTLETNQKPLVSIYRKHMVEILPRKLKLKLTPFGIVHHSKGLPFQVHLTVSTLLIITVMYVMY